MRIVFILVLLSLFLVACRSEKKQQEKTQEEVAVEALPENIGDKTAPTAIKAYKGAKEVRKRIDDQRKKDAQVLKESN